MPADPELTPAQAQIVSALAQGRSVTQAALEAGLHRNTVHNWLRNEPRFKTAVAEAQRDYAAAFQDGLHELAARAVDALRSLLDDPNTPPSVRLRTALAILEREEWRLPHPVSPEPGEADQAVAAPVARNAPCPCGSGNKYKRCCGSASPPVLNQRGMAEREAMYALLRTVAS
jgi:hypothetical protein